MAFAGVSRRGNERHGAPERNSLAHHARQVVDDHACLHVRKSGAAAALERAREVARTRTARQHRDREGSGHAAQDIGRGTIDDAGVADSASCALAAMDRRQGRRSRAAQGRARDAASGSSGLAPFRRDIKTIDAGAGVSRSEIDPPVGSMTVSGNPPLFALMFKNIESGLDQDKNTPENNELHGQPTLLAVPKRIFIWGSDRNPSQIKGPATGSGGIGLSLTWQHPWRGRSPAARRPGAGAPSASPAAGRHGPERRAASPRSASACRGRRAAS